MSEAEEMRCCYCGEPLEDGDVCFSCSENEKDNAYQEGYREGYAKGYEEGKRDARNEMVYEIETDYYIPYETRRRILSKLGY